MSFTPVGKALTIITKGKGCPILMDSLFLFENPL